MLIAVLESGNVVHGQFCVERDPNIKGCTPKTDDCGGLTAEQKKFKFPEIPDDLPGNCPDCLKGNHKWCITGELHCCNCDKVAKQK